MEKVILKKIKVVFIIDSLGFGGREKVVVGICNQINHNKYEVYVIALTNNDNAIQYQLNKNTKVINLAFKNNTIRNIILFWIRGLPQMIKLLNKINASVIHSHLFYNSFLFLSISLRLSKVSPAHFRTIHTSGLYYNSKTLINRFRILIEKWASKIYPLYLISISKEIHKNNQHFFSKYAKNIKLIPNGIDIKKFTKNNYTHVNKSHFGIDNNKIIVTYVARLDHGKNHICLINALVDVVKINPEACLCLLGDGVLKNALIKQAIDLNIEKSIFFLGNVENIAEFLAISDIGVFPSQFEGFPLALLEKMAMALPVIVSDIEVLKELITHNENGLIYKVNDCQQLSESINLLIKDKALRFKFATRAQKTAARYDIKIIVNEITTFYEEALFL